MPAPAAASEERPASRGLRASVVRTLRRVPQLTRTRRHLWAVLEHSTPRRIANLILVEFEYRLRRTRVRGHPYILIVDPTNVCNLRCPLCPTGTGDLGRRSQLMPWDVFTRAIDELAPWAYEVNLHNWGESLLHPHVFEMIAHAAGRNLAINMSSNFNLVRAGDIDRLIDSGLEYLTLSIDGATQETYERYRVRGRLDTVLENARALVARRTALKRRTPYVEWQFIVFKHNAHEIERARALAREVGVDRFRLIPPGVPFDAPDPDGLKEAWFVASPSEATGGAVEDFRERTMATACFYLYRSITVNPDGRVAPCCVVYGTDNDFGDLREETARAIWNGPRYRSARALFRHGGRVVEPIVCSRCEWFERRSRPQAGARPGPRLR